VRDWNIAHKEIDLKNWRGNRKLRLFARRARMAVAYLRRTRIRRLFRVVDARPDQYTWWSTAARPGLRMSAGASTTRLRQPGIARCARKVRIYKDNRYSDHAPLTIDYDYAP